MLKIRKEHMDALEQATLEPLVRSIMEQVRLKYSDRLPETDMELRESVLGWITDARRWGFSTDRAITNYADFCAKTQNQREPVEIRLKTYLSLYHEELSRGEEDLQEFVQSVIKFASRHKVIEDEGIAWLAVILLSGRRRRDPYQGWMEPILDQPSVPEESRLLQVHQQAVARGWISSARVS